LAYRFFSVQLDVPGEIRAWQIEGEVPETEDEVLARIAGLPTGWSVRCIIRCDDDVPPRDVTEDLARLDHARRRAAGWNPVHDQTPPFLARHAPTDCDLGYRGLAAE